MSTQNDDSWIGWVIGIGIFVLIIWGISASPSSSDNSSQNSNYDQSEVQDYDENSISTDEFHGYDCTDDCSGHEAGYDWADENDICSEYSYGDEYEESHSNSFNEGVTAYIEDNC